MIVRLEIRGRSGEAFVELDDGAAKRIAAQLILQASKQEGEERQPVVLLCPGSWSPDAFFSDAALNKPITGDEFAP